MHMYRAHPSASILPLASRASFSRCFSAASKLLRKPSTAFCSTSRLSVGRFVAAVSSVSRSAFVLLRVALSASAVSKTTCAVDVTAGAAAEEEEEEAGSAVMLLRRTSDTAPSRSNAAWSPASVAPCGTFTAKSVRCAGRSESSALLVCKRANSVEWKARPSISRRRGL
eukprot:scaffold101527_cov63-Phaeocystis_antarctica.AAC.6